MLTISQSRKASELWSHEDARSGSAGAEAHFKSRQRHLGEGTRVHRRFVHESADESARRPFLRASESTELDMTTDCENNDGRDKTCNFSRTPHGSTAAIGLLKDDRKMDEIQYSTNMRPKLGFLASHNFPLAPPF